MSPRDRLKLIRANDSFTHATTTAASRADSHVQVSLEAVEDSWWCLGLSHPRRHVCCLLIRREVEEERRERERERERGGGRYIKKIKDNSYKMRFLTRVKRLTALCKTKNTFTYIFRAYKRKQKKKKERKKRKKRGGGGGGERRRRRRPSTTTTKENKNCDYRILSET